LNVGRKTLGTIPIPYPFGFLVLEGYYHIAIVLLCTTNVKGKFGDIGKIRGPKSGNGPNLLTKR
jgi:hypothetical protein